MLRRPSPDESPDPEVTLRLPESDVAEPELSIVIPALNEELTITDFIAWCREGLAKAGIVGEILIVDSGTDRTAELALAAGARVLKTPKRGLGRAYMDALPHIRGKYVLMGDCDCTYDFRELAAFVEKFRAGAEFIMGSRFRGYIEPGAMPPLHRYLGTPVTTWILNVIFGSRFSDIHCGMRGITQRRARAHGPALAVLGVRVRDGAQVGAHGRCAPRRCPIRFLKDRDGPPQPPQALGLVLTLAGRVDQPARDVRLRRRLLPVQAGPAAARPRARC